MEYLGKAQTWDVRDSLSAARFPSLSFLQNSVMGVDCSRVSELIGISVSTHTVTDDLSLSSARSPVSPQHKEGLKSNLLYVKIFSFH